MFTLDAHSIDKNLPVPVGTQLHGLLSYMLAFGGFAYGERLPSVRKLAADLGIAPMTVVQVYHQLRDSGLIEMRQGSGAYAARPPVVEGSQPSAMALLHDDIARLLQRAAEINLSTMALVSMINAQSAMQLSHRALKIAFICIFPEAGSDYVRQIQPYLAPGDEVTLLTFDEISQKGPGLEICRAADLILTFAHREADARRLTQSEQVLGLRLIPSQKTRQELAGLDPRAKVLGVTYLKDYIAIMRPSIREFAPHVSAINVTWSSSETLAADIAESDAVIYATGADHVAAMVRPSTPCFEFRHAPDPGGLDTILAPKLARIRLDLPDGL